MKKKVLASVLAVCMMAGLAVPAFAYTGDGYDSSSVAATDEEITALQFAKDSYTVANGDEKNLAEELTAYASDKKIIQEPVLEWSISDSLAFGIDDEGKVMNIGEDTGSAVVTVKANGKTATTKVVAAKAKGKATSWKFEKTIFTTTDGADTITAVIVPSSENTKFTDAQLGNFITDLGTAPASATDANPIELLDSKKKPVAFTGIIKLNDDKDKIELVIDVPAAVKADYTLSVRHGLYKDNDKNESYGAITRNTKVSVKEGKAAMKVIRTSNVQIEVGQTADLDKSIAYTSGQNYNDGVTWSIEPINDDAEYSDYAVQNTTDRNKVLGIAVGKVKAVATMTNPAGKTISDGNATTSLIIEVVAKGSLAKPEAGKYTIAPATASPKVGDKVALTLNDANGKAVENVTWTVSNGALATVTTAANPTTLNAKAAGKVVVYARVADKVVATAEITVVGEGTTVKPEVPGTSNPSTGDSIFSNLF